MKRLCVAVGAVVLLASLSSPAFAQKGKGGGGKGGGHGHGHSHSHGHHRPGHGHGHHRHHHGHWGHGHRHGHHFRHHHYCGWRHYCWFPSYGCYGYYCPSACSWYYYYEPQQCYYPVSYITTYAPTTPGISINVNNNNNNNQNVAVPPGGATVPVGAVAPPPLPTGASALPNGFVPGMAAAPVKM